MAKKKYKKLKQYCDYLDAQNLLLAERVARLEGGNDKVPRRVTKPPPPPPPPSRKIKPWQ